MSSSKEIINKDTIVRFYKLLNYPTFDSLDEQRISELDESIRKDRPGYVNRTIGRLSLMTRVSEKVYVSNQRLGLNTTDEQAYYYVKIIDPDFLFLEAFESANTAEELKALCKQNFGFCDGYLIKLEKSLSKKLKELNPELEEEPLWTRGRIKKDALLNV